MKILFIGDIVGSPGRKIVADRLADIVESRQIDLVIANGENSAAGFGITPRIAEELFAEGIEVITGGNHIWDRKEILEYIPQQPRLVRPANFPDGNPGSGLYVGTARNGVPYAVLDLQGRVFMASNDCPFRAADRELARIPAEVRVIFVDLHAETTSEKIAMGWYLDGRASAVIGTHTHVATADEHVLPARNRVPDRRGDDRPSQRRDRHGQGRHLAPLPGRAAGSLRSGRRRHPDEYSSNRRG